MEPERIEPGTGQESAWDYPRPPALVDTDSHLVVALAGEVVADTRRAKRVLETSQPPAYYFPPDDVRIELLVPSTHLTFCEWKGQATYWSVRVGETRVDNAAWAYPRPTERFEPITGWFAFYPQHLDCEIDGEAVAGNDGTFYGGWITSRVVGPFKGGAGTAGW